MKYYAWDWYESGTITMMEASMVTPEYAASQGCYRSFRRCQNHGINELNDEIAELQDKLARLRAMTINDVENAK